MATATTNNSKEAVLEQLTKARIRMLLQQPFWGTLATRLILKDVTDEKDAQGNDWCPTAATDGRYMYYNRNFISKLTKQETIFLIAHEVEHVVYDHMSRRGGRNPKRWNAAADYVINGELSDHSIGKFPDPKTSGVQGCLDKKYSGMFAEQVYEQLPDGDYPEFDIHLEPGDGKGEEEGNSRVSMSAEELKNLATEIETAVQQAAKASNTGNLPGRIKQMLKDLTDPQMDWREILNMKIQSLYKNDYTWSKGNRKTQAMGIHLPGLKEAERIEVAIAIDSSGSMTEKMLRDLLGEVKGIMGQFDDFHIRLWCSDTEVYNEQIYTPENMDEIESYEFMGRGGNDFNCNWHYMKEKEIVPDLFVHMSDGLHCGLGWGPTDYCDTLYIIHSDPRREQVAPAPMMTVWYDGFDE